MQVYNCEVFGLLDTDTAVADDIAQSDTFKGEIYAAIVNILLKSEFSPLTPSPEILQSHYTNVLTSVQRICKNSCNTSPSSENYPLVLASTPPGHGVSAPKYIVKSYFTWFYACMKCLSEANDRAAFSCWESVEWAGLGRRSCRARPSESSEGRSHFPRIKTPLENGDMVLIL